MALEFKLRDESKNFDLFIDADRNGKEMWITCIDNNTDSQFDLNIIELDQMLELGTFLNLKLGFELFNIKEIEKQIDNK